MTPCLVDVNVLLALLVARHEHHGAARKWFDRIGPDEFGICRHVQLAAIRLLGNSSVMGESPLPASYSWAVIQELLEDERAVFLAEPPQLDTILPSLFNYAIPTNKLVADCYLAAFATACSRRVVSLDRGFRQFRGLDVELLSLK